MPSIAQPEIYSFDYYRRIAEVEDDYWWHRGMRVIQARLLDSGRFGARCGRALDAGCGPGGNMAWLRETCGAQWVAGVDIAPEALHFCRQRLEGNVVQGSVLNLPFGDASFDLLICLDVIQHLPTDGGDLRALKEMYRVLVPGGRLVVRANSRQGTWQGATERDDDFQRYLLPEIEAAFATAGFVVDRATYANALPALYASLGRAVSLFGARLRRLGGAGSGRAHLYDGLPLRRAGRLPRWLNELLFALMRAEARYLSAPGRRLPFGHTTFCVGRRPGQPASSRPRTEADAE